MLAAGDITSRISTQGSDKWGRWVTQELQGRRAAKLAIISAYQVVYKTGQLGMITAATQQVSLLARTQDILRNPRDAFIRDLSEVIREYTRQHAEVLLIGDFNETVGSDPAGITSLLSMYGLVNLMTRRHSAQRPATYARGRTCIDYALATQRFAESLEKCGYEPFNHRLHSDHRGYFFDFNAIALLGSPIQALSSRTPRILCSKNVKSVTEYIRKKHQLLEANNVFRRAERLLLPGNRHEYAERLDRDIVRVSLAAEKSITKFREPEWSNKLQTARRTVRILEKWLSMKRTGLAQWINLEQEASQLNTPLLLPTTVAEGSAQLRRAKQEVRNIVQNCYKTRDEEIRERIKELEKSQDPTEKKQLRRLNNIKKAEDKQQIFKKLAALRRTNLRQGVVRLEIPIHPDQDPKGCTEWQTIDVPQEILALLQARNRKHFGQAHGTPFASPPLSDQLGYTSADTVHAEQILKGEYNATEFAPSVAQLLRHLKQTEEMSSHPSCPRVSKAAFEGKIKSWRESTTTSPSGLHLGHYKALYANHSYSHLPPGSTNIEQKESLDAMQNELQQLHLNLMNYALQRGYSYKRWQTIANTMLFKDPDNFQLHRTRVIHIYEADFNLILGIKWRSAMHVAEVSRWLNEGQFGSRKRRNAIDPVLVEELQYEISRATRRSVLLTNYDAASCYDRILPNLAALVSRKFGVHELVTKTNFDTLQKAEYRVRTELGLAEHGYRHSREHPIYGTGQGSGNSPAIWCMLSSVLFDCYEETSFLASYHDPTNSIATTIGLLGFVDDCNGQTNLFSAEDEHTSIDTLLSQAQHNAQKWAELLHTSGGALELSKCNCHMLKWIFTPQGAPVLSPKLTGEASKFKVIDPSSESEVEIPILSSYQAHKTLGHFKEPAGVQKAQARQLRKLCKEHVDFLWRTPLSRYEAQTFYKTSFLPSISYPLSCSAMSTRQLESIQKATMAIIIARCGYNRHTKREIIYGPTTLGGSDFKSFYNQQGAGQIALFLRHSRSNQVTGTLLRIALSWFQVQVGISQPLLEYPTTELPHLESVWMKSIRQFLCRIGGSIRITIPDANVLQRVGDAAIMDVVMESGRFTPTEIKRLNYCRMYLKAITISDLATVRGDRLDMVKTQGALSLTSSKTTRPFIIQDRPSSKEWILWERANRLWSGADGTLHTPLGPWKIDISNMRQEHFAYATEVRMWIRYDKLFLVCYRLNEDFYAESDTKIDKQEIPINAVPVEVEFYPPQQWKITWWSQYMEVEAESSNSLKSFFEKLEPWEAELLEHTDLTADPRSIAVALEHGIVAVSDGSEWSQTQGAFGWAMSTIFGERVATGMGLVRGARHTSYRSEAHGLLSLLCFLIRLAEYTHQTDAWAGHLATDSQSLLDTLFGLKANAQSRSSLQCTQLVELDVMIPEWDVLIMIQERMRRLPLIDIQHIQGHQDKHKPYDELTLLAQLNVDADHKASSFQRTFGRPSTETLLPTIVGAALNLPQGTVTAHHIAALHSAASGPPLIAYIQSKNSWTGAIFESINWDAHGSALRANRHRHVHYVKLVHDILPTNVQIYRHAPDKQKCPLCAQAEDRDHIIRCHHPSRDKWRREFLNEVKQFCEKSNTCPSLQHALFYSITHWFQEDQHTTTTFDIVQFPDDIRPVIEQQSHIGWRQIFNGRFGTAWSMYQERYYSRNDMTSRLKAMTGKRWQTNLIHVIWNQWFLLWSTRNQDVHGADVQSRRQIETATIAREIRELHDARDQMEPSVQELLPRDVGEQLSQSNSINRNWLRIHGPTMRESIKRAKDLAIRGTRSIRSFFVPIR
ncbi:hypothetical protein MHU86_11327 [Fragilaria crotonensis]|nr:hypothetical protein MHU86_11327 [Fragilaria crotonensis]